MHWTPSGRKRFPELYISKTTIICLAVFHSTLAEFLPRFDETVGGRDLG